MPGSSPLTRGKRVGGSPSSGWPGLIPAHAGKTDTPYPSPPGLRLIPAHAGKTTRPALSRPAARAHPRSRGENTATTARSPAWPGSSPLTRGKPRSVFRLLRRTGLIPAHAGKTSRWARRGRRAGAHPRSRGENHPFQTGTRRYRGSSPLTRGKRKAASTVKYADRLIPAHAGKTRRRTLSRRCPRAHPRSRGENFRLRCGQVGACGSSPLTRGKRGVEHDVRLTIRLIPAHAGKTSTSWTKTPPSGAHPRSRGENW